MAKKAKPAHQAKQSRKPTKAATPGPVAPSAKATGKKTAARPAGTPAARPRKPTKSAKKAARPAAARASAAAATTPAKTKKNTSEENRGGYFFSAIKMWRLLHTDGGTTIFNKEELARRYFKGIENDEAPEPELHSADLEDEFDDDLHEPLDEDLENDGEDDVFHDGPPGAAAGADSGAGAGDARRVAARSASSSSPRTSSPYQWIKERHKRYVQRTIEKLKNYGIGIEDTDELGNVLDEDDLKKRKEDNPRAERWWRYDPHGEWAQEFDLLLNAYGVNGSELLAFMALRDLLEDMRGTPHQKALQRQLDRMMRCVPPKLREEAIEQSRSYRHSVGNTAKYIPKAEDLERWYTAALQRQQVVIHYNTPGERTRPRHVAALSTMFNREENSIYLLASELTPKGWGSVRQWKFDRVQAVKPTNLKNPRLADLLRDPLVRPAPHGGDIERLDANLVYDYSAGAWLEIGVKPQRMEIIVRIPPVGRPGMDEKALAELRREARRRAYGWMYWCHEKPFHPRQVDRLETLANGEKQLRLVVEKCYVKEMASRLLRLQDCFEVIEPRELVLLVQEYAHAISSRHH